MQNKQEIVEIKAGEKVELFSRSFSSVPMTYEFTAMAKQGFELLGRVEVHAKGGLRKKQVRFSQLQTSNTVKASLWDTFLTIYVVADADLKVTTPKRKMNALRFTLVMALLVIVVASAIVITQLL
ncbi:hypothetical protein [Marinicella litoralis]|uniref:Uncharacterized protein n=1 Tax=Marinicella litoralis TaxID=644220 RepID=A0A4R6XLZ4_9GAMM|nr:hypothetical protein [Marinicella litoralis]TDR20596.1 hypothetical protein C8D91_1570 [Marinicella litoralis]